MYNFDEIIDRRHTNAMNTDGFRDYIFHADESMVFPYKDEEFIRMWVADMEFATPDVVIDGIRERLDKRIFGYTRVFENSYYEAFAAWCRRRYGWEFSKRGAGHVQRRHPRALRAGGVHLRPGRAGAVPDPVLRLFQIRRRPQRAANTSAPTSSTRTGTTPSTGTTSSASAPTKRPRSSSTATRTTPADVSGAPEELERLAEILERHEHVGHLGRDTLRPAAPRPDAHAARQNHAGLRPPRHLHGAEQDLQHGGPDALEHPHPRRRACARSGSSGTTTSTTP